MHSHCLCFCAGGEGGRCVLLCPFQISTHFSGDIKGTNMQATAINDALATDSSSFLLLEMTSEPTEAAMGVSSHTCLCAVKMLVSSLIFSVPLC